MNVDRVGISHSIPDGALLVHSSIKGATCLGRVTDVLSAWCKNKLNLPEEFLSDFRLLIQSLLEFSSPKSGDELGQIELASHENLMVVATRFPCKLNLTLDSLSKELTQYWLNSDDLKLLKKMLSPYDRVEVRYHVALNLIEWRVIRKIKREDSSFDQGSSFSVMTDSENDITAGSAQFHDLGDLDFENWLAEAYRSTQAKSRAGEVVIEGDESQNEKEWARVVVDRETEKIDKEIENLFRADSQKKKENKVLVSDQGNFDPESDWITIKQALSEGGIENVLVQYKDPREAANQIMQRVRQLELLIERERTIALRKQNDFETLLRRKEYVNQRHLSEITLLNEKMNSPGQNTSLASQSDHFREKAIQMFAKLKNAKGELAALEKMNFELRRELVENTSGSSTSMSQKFVDEQNRKLERIQRALDAEKSKVKSLNERVMAAEKEAQGAGPLIGDLESKVEHTLKLAQQHKKETEQVKLKLVHSDAEKNKIKNELMKAQAQIQTLLKRQAS